ncbi:MAG: hypothetical protein ABIO55_11160 [Ginsengibacter sp.]
MTAKIHKTSALRAIKLLRKKKFSQGLPFMINSDLLPSEQCYLEYPDGSIKLVEADSEGFDFKVLEELDHHNIKLLKRTLKLAK